MSLPFTQEQFLDVFVRYNSSIWPLQFVLNALGVMVIVLCFRMKGPPVLISIVLAVLWSWVGLVYHMAFFSAINPVAYVFGALFVLEGVLFLVAGAFTQAMAFGFVPGLRGYAGALLLAYGLVVYPILGSMFGHVYPASPTFGVPCPTTIFTFGVLLWAKGRLPWFLLVIPFLWAMIGLSAALQLGIREDIGLFVSGIVGLLLLLPQKPVSMNPAAV